jgi:hypothetical protein
MKMGLVEMIEDVVTRAGAARGNSGSPGFGFATTLPSHRGRNRIWPDVLAPSRWCLQIAIGRVLCAIE